MTAAVPLAATAAAAGVTGAWELLAALEHAALVRTVGRILIPLRAAGMDGHEPTAPERRRLALVSAATLFAGGWLLAGPAAALLAGAGGPMAVRQAVAARRRRWRAQLAAGAPAVARALSDALAGGHSIRGAVAQAARGDGVRGAAGAELRACAAALALGEHTEVALERLRSRAADPSFDTIAAAVLLQRDAGGDLAGLLRSVAAAQEEARRVEADARSATAQARYTAGLVCALPLAAAVLAELARPGSIAGLLATPLAAWLAGMAAFCQVLAWVSVRRITRAVEGVA